MATNPLKEFGQLGQSLAPFEQRLVEARLTFIDAFTPTINSVLAFLDSINTALKATEPEMLALAVWEGEGGYVDPEW